MSPDPSAIFKVSMIKDMAKREATSSSGGGEQDPSGQVNVKGLTHPPKRVQERASSGGEGEGEGSEEGVKSHNIIFLPPHLLTTNPAVKWPAYFYTNYKHNPICWLGIFWLLIFILSVPNPKPRTS